MFAPQAPDSCQNSAMALSSKMLMDGEQTVLSTRTHIKALLAPFLILLTVSFAGAFLAARVGDSGSGWVRWVVVAVAAVLLLWGVVIPFLTWLLWTYNVTDVRIVEQKGILTRTGRVIPLSRINDVEFEKSLSDRMLGCGTLVIRNASEEAGLKLNDIPHIERFHRTVSTLIHRQQGTDHD